MASAAHTLSVLVDLFPLSFRLSGFHALHPNFPMPPPLRPRLPRIARLRTRSHCHRPGCAQPPRSSATSSSSCPTSGAATASPPSAIPTSPPPHSIASQTRAHCSAAPIPPARSASPRASRSSRAYIPPHQRSRRLRAVPDQTSDPATSTSSNTSTPNSPRSSPPSPRAVAPPVARGLSSSPSITANSSATTATSAVAGRLRCGSLYSTPPPVGSARC